MEALFYQIKADSFRYLCELRNGKFEEYKTKCKDMYVKGMKIAEEKLSTTSMTSLGIKLNFSVFAKTILENHELAVKIAKGGFESAIEELDTLSEEEYKDSTLVMQLLKDNLSSWTGDEVVEEEEEEEDDDDMDYEKECDDSKYFEDDFTEEIHKKKRKVVEKKDLDFISYEKKPENNNKTEKKDGKKLPSENSPNDYSIEDLIKIGVMYQIASKLTSFIAIEEKEIPLQNEMLVVDVTKESKVDMNLISGDVKGIDVKGDVYLRQSEEDLHDFDEFLVKPFKISKDEGCFGFRCDGIIKDFKSLQLVEKKKIVLKFIDLYKKILEKEKTIFFGLKVLFIVKEGAKYKFILKRENNEKLTKEFKDIYIQVIKDVMKLEKDELKVFSFGFDENSVEKFYELDDLKEKINQINI